jgi:3-isopropylmalate dehydratase small subunit
MGKVVRIGVIVALVFSAIFAWNAKRNGTPTSTRYFDKAEIRAVG